MCVCVYVRERERECKGRENESKEGLLVSVTPRTICMQILRRAYPLIRSFVPSSPPLAKTPFSSALSPHACGIAHKCLCLPTARTSGDFSKMSNGMSAFWSMMASVRPKRASMHLRRRETDVGIARFRCMAHGAWIIKKKMSGEKKGTGQSKG